MKTNPHDMDENWTHGNQSWNQKDDMDELNTWIEAWNEDENYDMDETKTHGLNHETEAEVDDMDEIEWKDMITLARMCLCVINCSCELKFWFDKLKYDNWY